MEIFIFLITLWLTFLFVRIGAHKGHDFASYDKHNPRVSKSRTVTGWLRRKTGLDWHHVHIGFMLLGVFILLYLIGIISLIILAISVSLIIDQIFPLLDMCCYFRRGLWVSIALHLVMSLIAIILFLF